MTYERGVAVEAEKDGCTREAPFPDEFDFPIKCNAVFVQNSGFEPSQLDASKSDKHLQLTGSSQSAVVRDDTMMREY